MYIHTILEKGSHFHTLLASYILQNLSLQALLTNNYGES